MYNTDDDVGENGGLQGQDNKMQIMKQGIQCNSTSLKMGGGGFDNLQKRLIPVLRINNGIPISVRASNKYCFLVGRRERVDKVNT